MSRREAPAPLTVAETAAQMRVCTATVYRAIRDGRLPTARVGRLLRVSPADLDDLYVTTAKEPHR